MRVLVADDDNLSRTLIHRMLEEFGYDVCVARDGDEALQTFLKQRPEIVVTDWMMPGLDGLTVVKAIRAFSETNYTYVIMVSARESKSDIIEGMQAGADEFLTKPIDREQLRARVRVGRRLMLLQEDLKRRITELEEAQAHVRTLQGFLPICAYCKNVRNEKDLWQEVEKYICDHESAIEFSHSICPDCFEKHVKPMQEKYYAKNSKTTST